MNDTLRQKIESLPSLPGVYLMKDISGRVIYVGKAVDLSRRVRSYFDGGRDPRPTIPALEREVQDLETIVVGNEKEALLLENELIKLHKPRFNIKLREGGNFVYLRLDLRQEYPRLEVVRKVGDDGARYFGPYPAARALRETLRVVNRQFQLRTCSDHDPRSHQRSCLLCRISRFPQISVYDIPPEEYRRHVEDAVRFLEGKKPELVESLRRRMDEASAALRFEEAARLRDRIAAVERTLEPQNVKGAGGGDSDVFGFERKGKRLAVYILYVREGRVIGGRPFVFDEQEFPDAELLSSFVNSYYGQGQYVPDEILLPFEFEGMTALAELLSERKAGVVRVLTPGGGQEREIVRMSSRNAGEALRRSGPGEAEAVEMLHRLQLRLGLGRLPRRIECFDVSHLHGESIVASKVAMTDGALDKSRYRRFRIRTVRAGNDFASMREAVARRLRLGLERGDLPDLIVLDGGRPQLSAAIAAMRGAGVEGVDVAALAKVREAAAPGPRRERAEKLPERIFVPGRKNPVVLVQHSPEMLALVRLRDEAHRFAVTYQKKLRSRERLRSRLEEVPGIGEKRKRALLVRFGSVRRIEQATLEELSSMEGMGPVMARRLYDFLHPVR